jgi:hypothetical protein
LLNSSPYYTQASG